MSPRVTLATATRVGAQLRRDRRTLAMIFVIPSVLLALVKWLLDNDPAAFQRIGPPTIGLFPLIIMFVVTSIAMLRERTTGTLERLMAMPVAKLDLLLGYGLAFAGLAAAQAIVTAAVGFGLLGIETDGPGWAVVLLAIANAVLGMALGLFLSAFARTEFQAVQFMPAFILPQLLVAGLFVPRESMPKALQGVADALPFTYAYDGLVKVALDEIGGRFWLDVGVVLGCIALALALGALTLRRRTP